VRFQFEHGNLRDQKDFSRLGTLYILALSTIATIIIIGQVLIQNFLEDQHYDSRVINVAGRQRMLSQRIAKIVLLLKYDSSEVQKQTHLHDLKSTVYLWRTSQEGLQDGSNKMNLPGHNSATIQAMFGDIDPYYHNILTGAEIIIQTLEANIQTDMASMADPVQQVLSNEDDFLEGMNAIVFQYDKEASEKVVLLRRLEYLLLGTSLVIILFEIIFIFRPTAKSVNITLRKLIESERNAQKMTKEIGALYASLEKSYEKLSSINLPVENPRLFAKTDKGGNLKYVSDSYEELTGYRFKNEHGTINDLFPGHTLGEDLMDDIIDSVSDGHTWRGEIKFTSKQGSSIWIEVHITPVFNNQQSINELLVVCTDLTKRKAAESEMHQKDREEIDRKIKEQKFRSVLILEGQEEERKRIAMDIHDGIGQLLTSLKFQIESIDPGNLSDARQKIEESKTLIKDLIKEVRRVTFNLKPTVLSDYGISAGLNVFIKEIDKLTNTNLVFENLTHFNERLPSEIENNIYRIVQEAINNAIKYAQSESIRISLSHTKDQLQVSIKDLGKGFDEQLLKKRDHKAESGNGFFNMFERTEYINGTLDVNSKPGAGTTVLLTVPLRL